MQGEEQLITEELQRAQGKEMPEQETKKLKAACKDAEKKIVWLNQKTKNIEDLLEIF